MVRTRFVTLPLLNKYRITTNGNAFTQGNIIFVDLAVPRFSELLPSAQELTLFTGGEDMTPQLRWGIYFYSAYTRSFESGDPVQIGSTVSGATPKASLRHAPYSTVASFNLESRVLIGFGNNSGAAFETGIASAALGMLLAES